MHSSPTFIYELVVFPAAEEDDADQDDDEEDEASTQRHHDVDVLVELLLFTIDYKDWLHGT